MLKDKPKNDLFAKGQTIQNTWYKVRDNLDELLKEN